MESGGARRPCLPWNTESLLSSEVSFVSGVGSLIPRGQPWSWGWGAVGLGGGAQGERHWISFPRVEMMPAKRRRPSYPRGPSVPPASPWLAGNIQSQ